jgi:hypothetical protein
MCLALLVVVLRGWCGDHSLAAMPAGAQHQLRGLPAGAAEPGVDGITGGGILPAAGAAAAAHDLRDAAAAAAQLASALLAAERRQAQAERRRRWSCGPCRSSKAARRVEGAARHGRCLFGA